MGLALLVWRDDFGQIPKWLTKNGYGASWLFQYLRLLKLILNKNGLGASCLARCFWSGSKVINQEWVWRFLVFSVLWDLRLLKNELIETKMGLALLVWRDVFGQTLKWLPRMDATLLGSFSIMRFEITKINFYELIRNKNGLGASCLARRIW